MSGNPTWGEVLRVLGDLVQAGEIEPLCPGRSIVPYPAQVAPLEFRLVDFYRIGWWKRSELLPSSARCSRNRYPDAYL